MLKEMREQRNLLRKRSSRVADRAKEEECESALISVDSRTSPACWLSLTWAWAQISQTTPLKFSIASL